jgi:mycofactocin precursor
MANDSPSSTEQVAQASDAAEPSVAAADEALLAGEFLVEEISIDGMCGVY